MTEQVSRKRSASREADGDVRPVDADEVVVAQAGGLAVVTPDDGKGARDTLVVFERGDVPLPRSPIASRRVIAERRLDQLEPAPAAASRAKRAFDVVASLIGLVVMMPVLLCVAILVRVTSSGTALYKQERVGLCGHPFTIVKFRTMHVDADERLSELLALHSRTETPMFKVPHDPRLTRVGGWLRRSSLDELPQLLSVLHGHMSLVGPRPQRMAEVELYEDAHFDRLCVRPGMTGMWQISGRSDLAWESAVLLDLEYVHHWRPALDMKILWRTVGTVLSGRGAE